jgi:AraC-like DNA-binding protein
MSNSAIREFTDPCEYEAFLRGAKQKVVVAGPGEYRAKLTRIDLDQLWMQRGDIALPTVSHTAFSQTRRAIVFLAEGGQQAPIIFNGTEVLPGQIVIPSPGAEFHHRSFTAHAWGAMSLTPEHLAAAGQALVGYDIVAPRITRLLRPTPHLMSRLLRLHQAACHLAATTPDVLAHSEVAKAIEQDLVRTMVGCVTEGLADREIGSALRIPVMKRLERLLEENPLRPFYTAEVCAEIGVSDRTLRWRCQEHLGMSPGQYFWLRRMNLARRALATADMAMTTVTRIAGDCGFWELGRFSVTYRRLFGESPSATLRRAPDQPIRGHPLADTHRTAGVLLPTQTQRCASSRSSC